MGVALVTIPILVSGLGVERFGLLTLAWMVVGYASLFDLGLGRALTKVLAARLGRGEVGEAPRLVWTALLLMTVPGVAAAAVTMALTPWLVGRVLEIPPELASEARGAFFLLAASIPIVIATTGLRGALEAHQRFGALTAIRIPLGIFNFVGPALVLVVTPRLDVIVAALVAARAATAWAHYLACARVLPSLRRRPQVDRAAVAPLLAFGGWMTVSNVVSPLMVQLDRFVIGALVSMSAVAFYATPYEIITKMWLVTGALAGVLFPAFTASLASDPARAARLLDRGQRYAFLATFPVTLAVVALAHPALEAWLGAEFAAGGADVLRWLAVGVFVNGMAHLPFAFVQGAGRPDLTAKLHLVEAGPYLLLLWWAVQRHGIVGAAIAWAARAAIDTAALFLLTRPFLASAAPLRRATGLLAASGLVLLAAGLAPEGAARVGLLAAVLAALLPVAWRVILDDDERTFARARLRGLLRSA